MNAEKKENECRQRPHQIEPRQGYTDERTYSWKQPQSEGPNGYYGYCGPTAASNILANLCGIMVSPQELAEACFGLEPGTTPQALADALNEIDGCGKWRVCHPGHRDRPPRTAQRASAGCRSS